MHPGTILALTLALASSSATAAMFKWTDADGNIQYGQYPPAGVDARRIEQRSAPPAAAAQTLTPQERLKQLEERQAREAEAQSRREAAQRQAEQKAENCRIARQNLRTLETGGRSRMQLPDGTVLSGEQKQAYIDKTREQIKEFCD